MLPATSRRTLKCCQISSVPMACCLQMLEAEVMRGVGAYYDSTCGAAAGGSWAGYASMGNSCCRTCVWNTAAVAGFVQRSDLLECPPCVKVSKRRGISKCRPAARNVPNVQITGTCVTRNAGQDISDAKAAAGVAPGISKPAASLSWATTLNASDLMFLCRITMRGCTASGQVLLSLLSLSAYTTDQISAHTPPQQVAT